jgi:hypothetical protein
MSIDIIVEGVKYNSLSELCESYGISYSLFTSRVANDWSVEEALGLEERNKSKKGSLVVEGLNGEISLAEFCRDMNVSYTVVRSRIKRGYTLEEAVTGKKLPKVTVNGVEYESLSDACEKLKMSYYVVCMRISNGWTLEEAFNPLGRKNVFAFGVEYPSLKKACEHFNVNYYKVRYLVKNKGNNIDFALRSLGVEKPEDIEDFSWEE